MRLSLITLVWRQMNYRRGNTGFTTVLTFAKVARLLAGSLQTIRMNAHTNGKPKEVTLDISVSNFIVHLPLLPQIMSLYLLRRHAEVFIHPFLAW